MLAVKFAMYVLTNINSLIFKYVNVVLYNNELYDDKCFQHLKQSLF